MYCAIDPWTKHAGEYAHADLLIAFRRAEGRSSLSLSPHVSRGGTPGGGGGGGGDGDMEISQPHPLTLPEQQANVRANVVLSLSLSPSIYVVCSCSFARAY